MTMTMTLLVSDETNLILGFHRESGLRTGIKGWKKRAVGP